MRVRVERATFDIGVETAAFVAAVGGAGAVVTFTGIVRDDDGRLERMEIEHYPGMTERTIASFTERAVKRWSLIDAMVIHRYGPLKPGQPIMMVATASRHRANAFVAAEFLMDYLKTRAPFWKKEIGFSGENWVKPTLDDEGAVGRW